MREAPDLPAGRIAAAVAEAFGLELGEIVFLPLGADPQAAAYRAAASPRGGPAAYFVKLRQGGFDETALLTPAFLAGRGLRNVLGPIPTRAGRLQADLDGYGLTVYPFVQGQDGFERPLSDEQWLALGRTIRAMHDAPVPPELARSLKRERFAPIWRARVREFVALAESDFSDPHAAATAALLREHRSATLELAERAEQLAASIAARQPAQVICHADLHGGNVLLDAGGGLYVIDWDTAILAPRERDLMFIGAGIGDTWNTSREIELFYQGYEPAAIDAEAIAYYRYERIIEDIAVSCEELLERAAPGQAGGANRDFELRILINQFDPAGVLALARAADPLAG